MIGVKLLNGAKRKDTFERRVVRMNMFNDLNLIYVKQTFSVNCYTETFFLF